MLGYGPQDMDWSPSLTEPYGRYEGSYQTTYIPVGPPIFINSPPIPFSPAPTYSGDYFSPPVENVVGYVPAQPQVSPTNYILPEPC